MESKNKDKIKIKISIEAYKQLLAALTFDNEYNCIRLVPSDNKCCKSSKLNIIFDNTKPIDIKEKIDDLTICYDEKVSSLFKEVIIVISKGTMYLKAIERNEGMLKINNSCTNCTGCSKKKCNTLK